MWDYTRGLEGLEDILFWSCLKYPLRFQVSLFLLSLSFRFLYPSLARHRFLYLICEHVCIACSTVACAFIPRYQLKKNVYHHRFLDYWGPVLSYRAGEIGGGPS